VSFCFALAAYGGCRLDGEEEFDGSKNARPFPAAYSTFAVVICGGTKFMAGTFFFWERDRNFLFSRCIFFIRRKETM
jgi:hypothetical protein